MQLRNCILIALAFDATKAEIEHAHGIINKCYGEDAVDPSFVVTNPEPPKQDVFLEGIGDKTANNLAPIVLDGAGIPWDERIHSKPASMTDKGVWKKRRGADPAMIAKVTAELLATVGAGAPAADATPPPAALPPLPGTAPGLPGLPPAAPLNTLYTELVKFVADNTQSPTNPAGRITASWLAEVLTYFGIAEGSLQNLAHATPEVQAAVDAHLRSALEG